jgi:hypothetical protein
MGLRRRKLARMNPFRQACPNELVQAGLPGREGKKSKLKVKSKKLKVTYSAKYFFL